jgi:hypothetical protein
LPISERFPLSLAEAGYGNWNESEESVNIPPEEIVMLWIFMLWFGLQNA